MKNNSFEQESKPKDQSKEDIYRLLIIQAVTIE